MSLFMSSFRQSFSHMSAPSKISFLVLLVLLCALLGSLLTFIIAIPIFHLDIAALSDIALNPNSGNIDVLKFFQITQSITVFIIPAMIAAWLFSESAYDYIKADKKPSGLTVILVLLTIVAAMPMLNVTMALNAKLNLPAGLDGLEKKMIAMEESAARLTGLFISGNSIRDLVVNFLMIAILPAIGEEFLFRGLIQRLFSEWTKNGHIAILITSFLFAFIHFQFFGFLPRFLLGLYFGYLFLWSGSIWIPVAGHLLNNGLAVIFYHFTSGEIGNSTLDTIGTADGGNYLFYISVFLSALFIGLIYLHETHRASVNRNFL